MINFIRRRQLKKRCKKVFNVKCDKTEKWVVAIGIVGSILFLIAFFIFAL